MLPTRKQLVARIKELENGTTVPKSDTRPPAAKARPAPKRDTGMDALLAQYRAAGKQGPTAKAKWWDQHGAAFVSAVKDSRMSRSEKARTQFEAMPAGPERSAFYKENRETLNK